MCRKGFPMKSKPTPLNPEQRTVSKYDIELPPSIVESYARFLIPEIRKFYESEQGKHVLVDLQVNAERIEKG